MIVYEIFSGVFSSVECGDYKSFGLIARWIDEGREFIVDSILDISTDEELVKSLCAYCNDRKIPPFSIGGIVEDFIG